jgi:predicted DNA-binding transcriptional regulator AlpA
MKTIRRIKAFAKKIGMSQRHVQRLIASGEGPVLTELGKRIKGVTDDDGDAWVAKRRKLPPSWIDSPVTVAGAVGTNDAGAPLGGTWSKSAGARGGKRTVQNAPQAHIVRNLKDPERRRARAAKKKPAE